MIKLRIEVFHMFNNIIRYVCIVLCLSGMLAMQSSYSQEYAFEAYSEGDGLPSNDIYDLLSARDGYMWFATDNGVSRYDGARFINISAADGLSSNTIIKLYEDYLGRVWFLAYNGTLSYYEDGSVKEYYYNDTIIKYFSDNYLDKILVDSMGNVVLAPRHGGKGIIDRNGMVRYSNCPRPINDLDTCFLSFRDLDTDYFITVQDGTQGHCDKTGRLAYCNGTYFLRVLFTSMEFQRNYVKLGEGAYLVSYRNCVFYIQDKRIKTIREFPEEVLALYLDTDERIWLSVKYDNGLYSFEDPSLEGEPQHFFTGLTVTDIGQDVEQGYWISTEGDGVFYTPGFGFNNYLIPGDNRKLSVMALALSGERLWFSTRDKEVYSGRLADGSISDIRKLHIKEPYDWIRNIAIDHNGYLWFSSTSEVRYDPAGFPNPPDTVIHANFIDRLYADTILVATHKLAYFHGGEFVRFANSDSARRVYSCLNTDDGLYLGTLYGLFQVKNGKVLNASKGIPSLDDRINCIEQISDWMIVGSQVNGITILADTGVCDIITMGNGLLNNNVREIVIENDSTFWAATKAGLNKIVIGPGGKHSRIEGYSMIDGLPSNDIHDMLMHEDHIWMATSNGLSSFNPLKIKPFMAPPAIRVNGVQVNGRDTIVTDAYVLDHDQNDLRISFTGFSFRHRAELKYRYRLVGFNDRIIETKNNWANFPNLPPGEYKFLVNVGNAYGIWNEQPKEIDIRIKKYFTQTLGFLIFLILFSLSLIVVISVIYQRQKKIKEQARADMARMEQKIFRLQMNPHFVFNALLAIQGFMYQQNTREAGRYLTSFAKLIRHTLYGSREELVPLNNELEAMKYYLELQRLRFNDNFDFKIDVGRNIFTEGIKIPPMLIQPFLENAIEHGLQHRKEGGLLLLQIRQEKNVLNIQIEDNGIGRKAALEIQKKKGRLHKSLGMEIVKSRLDSLKKIIGKRITMDIIDVKNDEDKATGTIVKIAMPL